MVGIVLVSHSRPLALAAQQLVQAMTGAELPLAIAAGTGENHADLGTDATEIMQAIESVMSDDGVLVLMDMGSAILSAETALDFLDESVRSRIRLCAAPLVEGALAAGVTAKLGTPLDQVLQEAERALEPKRQHLQTEPAAEAVQSTPAAPDKGGAAASVVVRIPNADGLHARPATVLVQACAGFDASIRIENTTRKRGPVSARSVISLALLEAVQGNEIRISATGRQAQEAVTTLGKLVESGLGDTLATRPSAPAGTPAPAQETGRAQGIAAGIAIGKALIYEDQPLAIPEHRADDPDKEKAALQKATDAARATLLEQKQQAQRSAGKEHAEIFSAQAMLLDDPTLGQMANDLITTDRLNAALAWHRSIETIAAKYRELSDETLRHRAADVEDVGRRVLAELGIRGGDELSIQPDEILVVGDLTPTRASKLAAKPVAGVVCLDGGRTSHSAILLRALGIPSVAQARPLLEEYVLEHKPLHIAFDGKTGEIWINPDAAQVSALQARQEAWKRQREREAAAAHEPATTTDGHRVELFANVGRLVDAEAAGKSGAEGIGLLRTEFLFLDRSSAPDEEQQISDLRPMLEQMAGKPVVVRTLDIGGDKDVPYLHLPREANPFLGIRALRLCLRRPELFQTQLRALLRVGLGHDLRLMFPMVSGPAELQQAKAAVERAHAELEKQGTRHLWPVQQGIMVEIPSAAAMADELAGQCDFFSIGTNDLTQYTLAADRGNPELADLQDALHPAVLRLISQTVEAAHRHQRPVAVCGEAAGDLEASLILVGLGVDELSLNPAGIPAVKAAIRRASIDRLRAVARDALTCTTTDEVRRLAARLTAAAG